MILTWQIAIAIFVVIASLNTIYTKLSLRKLKYDPVVFSTFVQLFTSVLLTILCIFIGKFAVGDTLKIFPNIIFTTLLYGFANILIFKALAKLPVSTFVVIFATRIIFISFLSSQLMNEELPVIYFFGTFLVLISIFIVNYEKKSKLAPSSIDTKSIIYALFASILVGFAAINDRVILQNTNPYFYTLIAYLLPGLFMFVLYFKKASNALLTMQSVPSFVNNIIIVSFLSSISALFYFLAIDLSGQVAKVASIGISSVIVTILLSFILLKERSNPYKKIFASILCFFGLYLIL